MKSVDDVKQFVCELLGLFPDMAADRHTVCTAYYWANRFACEKFGTLVSIHPCVKLTHGPGFDRYNEILDDMENEGAIVQDGDKIRLLENPRLVAFPAAITESIRMAYDKVKDENFDEIKNETHSQKSVGGTPLGGTIDVTDDFISDEEIEDARQALSELTT